MGLQKGSGLSTTAASSSTSTITYRVGDDWSDLPVSPSNGDRTFLRDYALCLCYLAALGGGMWVPEILVTGDVGSETLSSDVDTLLWAPALAASLDDTDPVATWTNLGSGGNYTAAGSARPTFSTSMGPGTSEAVDFDGTANILAQTSPTLLNAKTGAVCCALWNPDTLSALVDNPIFEVATNAGTEERWRLYQDNAIKAWGRVADTDTTESATAASKALPAIGAWIAAASVFDAANTALSNAQSSKIIGAVDDHLSFGGGATVTDSTNPDHLEVGGSSSDSLYANGQLVGLVVVEGDLASTNLDRLRVALQSWFEAYAGT